MKRGRLRALAVVWCACVAVAVCGCGRGTDIFGRPNPVLPFDRRAPIGVYLSDVEPLIERFVDALAKQNGGALGYDGSAKNNPSAHTPHHHPHPHHHGISCGARSGADAGGLGVRDRFGRGIPGTSRRTGLGDDARRKPDRDVASRDVASR